jgi:predicted HTH transcriptional regulator
MHPVELEQLIRQGETQDVEFESSIPIPQVIAKHVAALANTNGGQLLLGVKEPGEIVGVNEQPARAAIEAANQYLSPLPVMKVQTLEVHAHAVVVVEVAASEELHSAMGGYFGRGTRPSGPLESHPSATRPLNPAEIRQRSMKGRTEDFALSRLATAVAEQTRAIEKQADSIGKLTRDFEKANSLWIKLAWAFAGVISGAVLMYFIDQGLK